MDSIFESGWDSTQVNAVAIEVDPNTDMDVLEFNKKVTIDSIGLLPQIPAHKLLFASLSASHTNAGLRCIAAQCPHDSAEMCINGMLSAQVIGQKDVAFAEAVGHGLDWKVLSKVVGQEFPHFLQLVQSALNSSGQVAKGEHELQILKRMGNVINAAKILS